jgi:hypothetical protein
MNTFLATAIATISLIGCASSLPDDPSKYKSWEENALKTIDSLREVPRDEAIPRLGSFVFKLSKPAEMEHGDRPVYQAAKKMLITIPEYAIWYEKRIKELTDRDISGLGDHRERYWCFEILSEIQSAESVRVLGELLFDGRDPWKSPEWGDGGRPYANSFHAVRALHHLGIRNPPTGKYVDLPADVRTWQLWFEQVRAGTRTFSFEGSDTIYSLEGPVVATPSAIRPGNSATNPSDQTEGLASSPRSFPWVFLASGMLVILVAYAILRSKGRQVAGR